MELAFRKRIAMVKDPNRRKYALADRYIEVVNEKLTGEVLLDETLKMINSTQERMSVGQWIDLLSGTSVCLLSSETFFGLLTAIFQSNHIATFTFGL